MSSDTITPDRLYSPRQVSKLENVCLATTYARMAKGEYGVVFKDGRKTALIGQSILERRSKNLKPATFKVPVPQGSRWHTLNRSSA
jgi:hypothetical protein